MSSAASLGAPIAAPPPSQDDESSDSSDDDVEDTNYRVAKKPRLSTDADEDEPDDEMDFGYEQEAEEEPEEEDEDEEDEDDERDDEDHERHENDEDTIELLGADDDDREELRRTSMASSIVREVMESEGWENGSDEDEAEYTDGSDGEQFDSPAAFLTWLAKKKECGADPRQILVGLLNNSQAIPPALLWGMIDSVSGFIARSIITVRRKLPHINLLDDVCELLSTCNNIIVISGAGVSVSSGIPDFRSKQGIYSKLRDQFGMPEPECMFDLQYFRTNPDVFYSFAHELWPGNHEPSSGHQFIALLEQKGKLLRNYSQNIDNLESRAGIKKVYQCHGSFATATCQSCARNVPGETLQADIMAQRKSYCCICRDPEALANDPESETKLNDVTFGLMKPDIIFFGEPLSREFDELLAQDIPKVDLVIAMGSSLKVHPVAGVFSILPPTVPLLLINKELVGRPHEFDVQMLGYCDDICRTLCSRMGWSLPDSEGHTNPSEAEFVSPNRYLFPGNEAPTPIPHSDSDLQFRRPRSSMSEWYLGQSPSQPAVLLSPQVVSGAGQLSVGFTDDELPSADGADSDIAAAL